MSDLHPSLDDIHRSLWNALESGKDSTSNPWRLPVLATSGSGPQARTVVLRDADAKRREMVFHTDTRSPKVAQLSDSPEVNLVFYDGSAQTQLVVQGTASLHGEDHIADRHWRATPASSRRGYLAPMPPGTRAGSPSCNLPAEVVGRVPTESEVAGGRQNFTVIVVSVTRIDWLRLGREGNLRALFEYDETGELSACWLEP